MHNSIYGLICIAPHVFGYYAQKCGSGGSNYCLCYLKLNDGSIVVLPAEYRGPPGLARGACRHC